jgi:hypothetical protein
MQKSKFVCWPAAGRDLPVFWPSEATFLLGHSPDGSLARLAGRLASPDWPRAGLEDAC